VIMPLSSRLITMRKERGAFTITTITITTM
jgi:hypothetical protein